ncbi:hypothetical protein AB4Z51_42825, partial [Bradyrhizobium sp. 2TAF36]|uniref:hypothetical protein n=1 Tax=Bradyrhizobium sp. 2TAF36 TaxID=3233016 RepID=UPI003F9352A8
PSGNHESPKSKILKRKKARSNTPLSCKIEYYIKTNSAYFSDQSAFFTDDFVIIRYLRSNKWWPAATCAGAGLGGAGLIVVRQ